VNETFLTHAEMQTAGKKSL